MRNFRITNNETVIANPCDNDFIAFVDIDISRFGQFRLLSLPRRLVATLGKLSILRPCASSVAPSLRIVVRGTEALEVTRLV